MTTLNIASLGVTVSGKGKAAREGAWLTIATTSMHCEASRSAMITAIGTALGTSPSDADIKAAKREYVIGTVAARLPVSELPKGKTKDADRLEFARLIVTKYAMPAEEGKEARPLRAGQLGRQTAVQSRIIRNAEKAWSLVLAETGHGKAQTMSDKNTKQRAPQMAGSTARGKQEAAPVPPTLVPAAAMSSDEYVNHMTTQLRALAAFDKKHAAKRPTPFGKFAEELLALCRSAETAANEYKLNKDKAAAKAAA